MSNHLKAKKESRQQSSKNLKTKNSYNTLGSTIKENPEKKAFKDLSLNFLTNYINTTLANKTCVNHSHKKLIIKEKSRINNNKKISLNIHNHNKLIKFPFKINYKQSTSLKNLTEEENLLNPPLRSSEKRKNTNTNTKIDLFSTNSTLSFLNIKDNNNKESSKPIKIKCFNNNKRKKKFASTFIEKKIKQKCNSNSKLIIKHIKNDNYINKDEKISLQNNKKFNVKENTFNNSNKSIEFCLSYVKPINKRRNLSFGFNDNSNSNTNSIKELYNKKIIHKNFDSNLLYDNMSFSLNKNKNNDFGNSFHNKINYNTYFNQNLINNNTTKKINLSSLPNLLCNNYMNIHNNFTMSSNDLFSTSNGKSNKILKYTKNKRSYQNIFKPKKNNKNYIKLNNINYNNISNINKNKNKNNNPKNIKENEKKEEINGNKQLKNIHLKLKCLLDGLYNIYLNANRNINKK